jgi:hypothetical protein
MRRSSWLLVAVAWAGGCRQILGIGGARFDEPVASTSGAGGQAGAGGLAAVTGAGGQAAATGAGGQSAATGTGGHAAATGTGAGTGTGSSGGTGGGSPKPCQVLHDVADCGAGSRCTIVDEKTGATGCVAVSSTPRVPYDAC